MKNEWKVTQLIFMRSWKKRWVIQWDVPHLFLIFHGNFFLPTAQRILVHGMMESPKNNRTFHLITNLFFQLIVQRTGLPKVMIRITGDRWIFNNFHRLDRFVVNIFEQFYLYIWIMLSGYLHILWYPMTRKMNRIPVHMIIVSLMTE